MLYSLTLQSLQRHIDHPSMCNCPVHSDLGTTVYLSRCTHLLSQWYFLHPLSGNVNIILHCAFSIVAITEVTQSRRPSTPQGGFLSGSARKLIGMWSISWELSALNRRPNLHIFPGPVLLLHKIWETWVSCPTEYAKPNTVCKEPHTVVVGCVPVSCKDVRRMCATQACTLNPDVFLEKCSQNWPPNSPRWHSCHLPL